MGPNPVHSKNKGLDLFPPKVWNPTGLSSYRIFRFLSIFSRKKTPRAIIYMCVYYILYIYIYSYFNYFVCYFSLETKKRIAGTLELAVVNLKWIYIYIYIDR